MSNLTIATLVALAATCIVCAVLVFAHDYEDGVVGRIFLVLIMLGAGALSARTLHWHADIDPAACVFAFGVAGFMLRHLYRFLRALHDPAYQWRRAANDRTLPGGGGGYAG